MLLEKLNKSPTAKIGLLLFFVLAAIVFLIKASAKDPEMKGLVGSEEPEARVAGGLGAVRQKDDEAQEAVNMVKSELEKKLNKTFTSLDVINYKRQVVAGLNYFAKVRATEDNGQQSILHLRIYRDIRQRYELTTYQVDKSEADELGYFQ